MNRRDTTTIHIIINVRIRMNLIEMTIKRLKNRTSLVDTLDFFKDNFERIFCLFITHDKLRS